MACTKVKLYKHSKILKFKTTFNCNNEIFMKNKLFDESVLVKSYTTQVSKWVPVNNNNNNNHR